jgi:hypothetical protein
MERRHGNAPPGLPGSIVPVEAIDVLLGDIERFSLPAGTNFTSSLAPPICVSPGAPGENVLTLHL